MNGDLTSSIDVLSFNGGIDENIYCYIEGEKKLEITPDNEMYYINDTPFEIIDSSEGLSSFRLLVLKKVLRWIEIMSTFVNS